MAKIEDLFHTQSLFTYLEKQKKNQKFVRSIEMSASFILITFFLVFAIRPTAYTISSLLGEIKAKEILSKQKLKPKIQNIIEAQQNFALIQQDYYLINASLPDSASYSHLATQVLGSGNQSQVLFPEINFNLKQSDRQKASSPLSKNLSYYQTDLNQSTRFSSAISLLTQLLNNRRLFEIEKITLSLEDKTEDLNGQIRLGLSIKVPYWQSYEKK
jgi:hypothetical protein